MIKNLLCKIGLYHPWIELGTSTSLFSIDWMKQCKNCKLGHHAICHGTATVVYTAEAMKEAWDTGKIDNKKAYEEIYGEDLKT